MPISLGTWAVAGAGGLVSNPAMELISTQVLGSPAYTVSFSSIPQTYKHLQIRISVRSGYGSGNDYFGYRINGVSTGVYSWHCLSSYGSLISENGRNESAGQLRMIAADNDYTGNYSALIIDIPDYTNSSKRPILKAFNGFQDQNISGNKYIQYVSGMMNSQAAVSSIEFGSYINGQQLKAGSRFSLYGILG